MTATETTYEIMTRYFAAEKSESLLFIGVGIIALILAVVLWRGSGAIRGMAIPLAAVALIQLTVGATVYLRTDGQVATLAQQLKQAPDAFKRAETTRMRRVMTSFQWYKALEVGLILLGLASAILRRPPSLAFGIGVGLVLQAGLMLALDFPAEHRGQEYLRHVQTMPIPGL